MRKKKKTLFLAFLNLAAFAAVIVINALANILPINGYNTGELSDAIPNLFVPAGLTFSIWGLIYALLALFVGYQFYAVKRGNFLFVEKIGLLFLASSIANFGWILAWHYKRIALSLALMLVILSSLVAISIRLRDGRKRAFGFERLAVYHTFSIYLGWISVATIANVTAVLVTYGWDGFGIGEETWTVLAILTAVLLGLLSIVKTEDVPYAMVIVWALLGILIKRYSAGGFEYVWIITASAIGISAMIFTGIYKMVRK